jgi:hypothetical protein
VAQRQRRQIQNLVVESSNLSTPTMEDKTTDYSLEDDIQSTHPGFIITCQSCTSTEVYVDSDLGHSAASGSWGSVKLVCNSCEKETDIYGPF